MGSIPIQLPGLKNELVRRKIEFFVNVMPPATVQLEGDITTENTTANFRIFCCGFFEGKG